jgi:hypothetical protein
LIGLCENIATTEPSFGKLRFDRQRPLKSGYRLTVLLKTEVDSAATTPRFGQFSI